MSKNVSLSKFYKTFSGTDTIAFLMFPGISPIVIGSLTTVSYSMYRNKVPVINIGRTNINGITRGSRIYAGTMVFTLINKHWVRELQDRVPYLAEFTTIKTDELPLFDIMVVSANEYGSSCTMFIYGIDFTDEAQTLSIEDLFTENVFKFVAREIAVFDEVVITASGGKPQYYTINTGIINNYYVDEQARQTAGYKLTKEIRTLDRVLYLNNNAPMIGNDVAGIQQLLNMILETTVPITYKFDRITDKAVRDFQTTAGLIVNGIVDNSTYVKLLQYAKDGLEGEFVQIINKSGAYVYNAPDTSSSITKILPYLSSVQVLGKYTNNIETFYQTQDGYLSLYDTYNYLDKLTRPTEDSSSYYIDDSDGSYTYELLKYQDEGSQVTILQNALSEIYTNFQPRRPGYFDEETENYVRLFQNNNDLVETGIVDYYTWNVLLEEATRFKEYFRTNYSVQNTYDPGTYSISLNNLERLQDFKITVNTRNTQQIKYSVISIYKDGATKTDSKTLTFEGSQEHSPNEFVNMFIDDIQHQTPTDVYYIVYPYGSIPYKWHFKIMG